jgi:hypothetical protein
MVSWTPISGGLGAQAGWGALTGNALSRTRIEDLRAMAFALEGWLIFCSLALSEENKLGKIEDSKA